MEGNDLPICSHMIECDALDRQFLHRRTGPLGGALRWSGCINLAAPGGSRHCDLLRAIRHWQRCSTGTDFGGNYPRTRAVSTDNSAHATSGGNSANARLTSLSSRCNVRGTFPALAASYLSPASPNGAVHLPVSGDVTGACASGRRQAGSEWFCSILRSCPARPHRGLG